MPGQQRSAKDLLDELMKQSQPAPDGILGGLVNTALKAYVGGVAGGAAGAAGGATGAAGGGIGLGDILAFAGNSTDGSTPPTSQDDSLKGRLGQQSANASAKQENNPFAEDRGKTFLKTRLSDTGIPQEQGGNFTIQQALAMPSEELARIYGREDTGIVENLLRARFRLTQLPSLQQQGDEIKDGFRKVYQDNTLEDLRLERLFRQRQVEKSEFGLGEGSRVGDIPASSQELLRNEGLVDLINDPNITQGSGSLVNPPTSTTNPEVLNALKSAGLNVDEVFGEAPSPGPHPQIVDKDAKLSKVASNVAFDALKTRLATQPIQIPPGSTPQLEQRKVQQGIEKIDADIRNINTQIVDRINAGETAAQTAKFQEKKIEFLQDQFRFKQTNTAIIAGIKILEQDDRLTGDERMKAYNNLFQLMLNDSPDITPEEQSFLDSINPFRGRGVKIAPGGKAPRGEAATTPAAPSTAEQEEQERRHR